MTGPRTPTVTAVIAAYQAEEWIAEAIEAILAQTHPADQIVVVNDGSTDGTARELARFGDRITVVDQANAGCPAAFNSAFAAATSDYVALCGADDVWEPEKLAWQVDALRRHPAVDVLFGDAQIFGLTEGTYATPPGTGVLDSDELRRALFRENLICAPSVMIRRALFERLGPFVVDFGADDYEYWMRCLRAGATFFFDDRVLLRYRRHESNLSSGLLWMQRCSHDVHRWYATDVDGELAQRVLAGDLFKIGRHLVDEGEPDQARIAFRASLSHRFSVRALAWTSLLQLPPAARDGTGTAFVRLSRRLEAIGCGPPA